MKKLIISAVVIVSMGVIGTFGFLLFELQNIKRAPFSRDANFVVKEGDTLYAILSSLKNDGVIKNELLTKIGIKVDNLKIDIKPGEYSFDKNSTLNDVISKLNEGNKNENYVKITIPEGYSIEKIGSLLEESSLNITKEQFIDAVNNYQNTPSYIKNLDNRRYKLEGFLFPDTYHFDDNFTANDVINTMLKRFEAVLEEVKKETGKELSKRPYAPHLTMSSTFSSISNSTSVLFSFFRRYSYTGINFFIQKAVSGAELKLQVM